MPEGEPKFKGEGPKEIRDAKSFEELYKILGDKDQEKIFGDTKNLINIIKKKVEAIQVNYTLHSEHYPLDRMHLYKKDLERIPKTHGLRNQVAKLIYGDEVSFSEWEYNKLKEEERKKKEK